MVGVKRTPNGRFYVFFRDGTTERFVRATHGRIGNLHIGQLTLPEELVGERIRVRIEIVKKIEKETELGTEEM